MKEFKNCLEDIFNTIIKAFNKFMSGEKAKRNSSRISGITILLSVISLIYVVDNAYRFNTYQVFALVIICLYFITQAGSLWIITRLETTRLMEVTFLKITSVTVSTIGLLAISETLSRTETMEMMEIFFMLLATALPLTVGKILWDMSKDIESNQTRSKVNKKQKPKENISEEYYAPEDIRQETFNKAMGYKEQMDLEEED